MRSAPFLSVAILSSALTCTASAGLAEENDRYAIVPFDKGVVRVDRRTGRTDRCRDVSGRLVCELAADERLSWQRETESLADTVSRLEKRIARLEREGIAQAAPARPDGKLPSDDSMEEMEKAWTITETFIRRFFNLVESLKSDREKGDAL